MRNGFPKSTTQAPGVMSPGGGRVVDERPSVKHPEEARSTQCREMSLSLNAGSMQGPFKQIAILKCALPFPG